jgi:tetratricopeptide (TPR) repeat protein
MMQFARLAALGVTGMFVACSSPPPLPPVMDAHPVEAISLIGDTLRRPIITEERLAPMRTQRDSARVAWEADESSPDALIWYARRVAYLGQFGDAIDLFSLGHDRFPEDPRFLRHRGHRYLTTRQLDLAVADFERAASMVRGTPDQVEPDGQPNARNIPTSTLQSNIFYHLGLARYLQGDFERALAAWSEESALGTNPDMRVATSYWRYLTLRRLGRSEEARALADSVAPDLDIIENTAYHRLLLLFSGRLSVDSLGGSGDSSPADASTTYGVGAWHLIEGRPDSARVLFRRLVTGPQWPAFGVLAAEAELARQQQ